MTKSMGNLLYHMATRFKGSETRAALVVDYVCSDKLTSEPQLAGTQWHSNINFVVKKKIFISGVSNNQRQ